MSSKFGQMRPLVSMAKDWVTVGKTASSLFLERFDQIHFILAGNDDIHKSLNDFEIWLDQTTRFHGNRVIMAKTVSPLFMSHNFEKVGSILVSACACVHSFVLPSVQKKIQARVLKFHIWIPRQKIAYPYFFSCLNYLPLPSYAPFKGRSAIL